eukprot:3869278-Pyramimonas_sp.AAC.1
MSVARVSSGLSPRSGPNPFAKHTQRQIFLRRVEFPPLGAQQGFQGVDTKPRTVGPKGVLT